MTPPAPDRLADRVRGALVGLAVGDALGTTVEFRPPGTFTPVVDLVGGGAFALPAGAFTDDTSMALCLAESLVACGGRHDPADQLRRYVAWWRDGHHSSTGSCFDIGGATRAALARFEATGDPAAGSTDERVAGNGSLMRLAPAAVIARSVEDAAARAAASSRTTHGAPQALDACRLLGAMLYAATRGAPREAVLDPGFWTLGPLHPEVEAVARGSHGRREPPTIRGSGYVVDCLEAALWAVGRADGYADAVRRAANLGDDADTTAAVAGQLAGALWGERAIPDAWRARLALADVVADLAAGLVRLAVPPVPRPDAWWAERGRVLAGEYPGHRDPATAEARLRDLLATGVRTVVDLTTPADGLAPYTPVLARLAAAGGLDVRHVAHPIPDLGVPASRAAMREALAAIDAGLARGAPVYVHCWGGIGRTGTVIGCWLVEQGVPAAAAVATIAALRAGSAKAARPAPETAAQRAFVEGW